MIREYTRTRVFKASQNSSSRLHSSQNVLLSPQSDAYVNKRKFNEARKKFEKYGKTSTNSKQGVKSTIVVEESTNINTASKRDIVSDNIKTTFSMQESGEWEVTKNEIEYHIDGLKSNSLSVQTLSTLRLAKCCKSPQIRVYLRAQGCLSKCMCYLQNICVTPDRSLRLYMAVLAYYLTSDRENLEYISTQSTIAFIEALKLAYEECKGLMSTFAIDQNSAKGHTKALKRKQKKKSDNGNNNPLTEVQQIFEDDSTFGFADDNIQSYIKYLLLLTLRNTMDMNDNTLHDVGSSSQKYKEINKLLQQSGGLDIVVMMSRDGADKLKSISLEKKIPSKIFKKAHLSQLLYSLKLLEHVSFLDTCIQDYLSDTTLIATLLSIMKQCADILWQKNPSQQETMHLIYEILLSSLRVVINLTNGHENGCQKIASLNGTICILQVFLRLWEAKHTPNGDTNPSSHKIDFDVYLLSISAITNCIEKNKSNRISFSKADIRSKLMDQSIVSKSVDVSSFLIQLFLEKIDSYLHLLLEEKGKTDGDMEKSREHDGLVEDIVIGGSLALLMGCLMRENTRVQAIVLGRLPEGSPYLLVRVLEAYVNLHSQMGAITNDVLKSIIEVIQELKVLHPNDSSKTILEKPLAHASSIEDLSTSETKYAKLSTAVIGDQVVSTPPASAFRLSPMKPRRPTVDSPDTSPTPSPVALCQKLFKDEEIKQTCKINLECNTKPNLQYNLSSQDDNIQTLELDQTDVKCRRRGKAVKAVAKKEEIFDGKKATIDLICFNADAERPIRKEKVARKKMKEEKRNKKEPSTAVFDFYD